jgi:hypothetical protein
MSIVAIGIASDTLAIAQLVGEIFVATISTVSVKNPCYPYG